MRAVSTVPEAVECDARYAVAGPGRLHLNVCVCGRIGNFAKRMSGSVGCTRETSSKLEAGSSKNEDHVGRSRNEDRVCRSQIVEQEAHSQQRWQPLEDWPWNRVVGREGTERELGEAMMVGKEYL
jgi:hypothetical protein